MEKSKNIKKFFSIVGWLILVLFFISIILMLSYFAYADYNEKKLTGSIRNITSIFTCLVASISLIYTSVSRHNEIKTKQKSEKNNIEYKWFESLIFEKYIDRILEFCDFCILLVNKLECIKNESNELLHKDYQLKIKNDIISPFTNEYTMLQQSLVSDAKIINFQLCQNIQIEFQGFQDKFLSHYINQETPNYEETKSYILDFKTDLIMIIKNYAMGIIDE